MKFQGQQLIETLRMQGPPVCLTDDTGRVKTALSPRYVADLIAGGDWTGYGKHGEVERVRPSGLSIGPFVTKVELARAMKAFPRLPVVQKNPQSAGAAGWSPQPSNSRSGSFGAQKTLFFRP